jgi:hypothetical protein
MSLFDSASLCVTPNGVKEGKLYSIKPSDGSGDLSVTRATTATRVNSVGLVELVPVNLLTYSNTFTNSDWTKRNSSIDDDASVSPSGLTNASKLQEDTATGQHDIYQYFICESSKTYTMSFYAKAAERNFCFASFSSTGLPTGDVFFNLQTGVVVSSPTGITSTMTNVGNGWYRCEMTATSTSLQAAYFVVGNASNGTTKSYAGTTGNGIYIYGAQLVEGSSAKDYYPTTTRLNIPRLDYTNGSCPSILVEPQRTNLLTYSNDYADASWQKPGLTISLGTQVNPQGIASTYSISNTTLGDSYLQKTGLSTTTGNYTMSVFVKNIDNVTSTQLMAVHLTEGSVTSELTYTWATNTFVLSGTNAISGSSVSYANGWVRLTFTYSIGALTTLHWSRLYANRDLAVTKSILVYGFQCEAGSYATSYIPTTSASVTRNADVISKTGISSLIGQTEGTLFVDFYYQSTNNGVNYIINSLNNGDYGNSIFIDLFNNSLAVNIFNAYNLESKIIKTSLTTGRHKVAVSYKLNDIVFYVDGVQIGTDTTATIPTLANLNLGYLGSSISTEQSFINASALWKTRLTDDECINLTTI